DAARALGQLRTRDHRRRHFHHFSSNNRTRIFRLDIYRHPALEPETFDRLLSSCAELVVTGAAIHNSGVVVRNVGHIGRLVDDGDVAFGRNQRALDALPSEVSWRAETILFGPDVVRIIGPILTSGAAIEKGL